MLEFNSFSGSNFLSRLVPQVISVPFFLSRSIQRWRRGSCFV